MKQNPDSQIEVKATPGLEKILFEIFLGETAPDVVIETDTYLGTGTTQILVDAIRQANKQDSLLFYTIEGNREYFKQACKNLASYPWIQLFHGLSVNRDECIQWIETDPYILYHEDYPDIFIDDANDPMSYYKSEFRSEDLGFMLDENMLESLTENFPDENIFFCLDSCGGIGYLEFDTVNSLMGNRGFYLFIDGVNHLKHARSADEIRTNVEGRWVIEYQDDRVMVAKKRPKE